MKLIYWFRNINIRRYQSMSTVWSRTAWANALKWSFMNIFIILQIRWLLLSISNEWINFKCMPLYVPPCKTFIPWQRALDPCTLQCAKQVRLYLSTAWTKSKIDCFVRLLVHEEWQAFATDIPIQHPNPRAARLEIVAHISIASPPESVWGVWNLVCVCVWIKW